MGGPVRRKQSERHIAVKAPERGGKVKCVICGKPLAPYHNVIFLNTFGCHGPAHAYCAAKKALEVLPIRQEALCEPEEE